MTSSDILIEAFNRIEGVVHSVLDGATDAELTYRPDENSNSVAWLIWHLTRVQDGHVADAAGVEPLYSSDGWVDRFDLPLPRDATGYGMTAEEVAKVRADTETLAGYFDAVHKRSIDYLSGLGDSDLDRVVDTRWNPPVTLMVRLVSVISDDLQHAGQASYVRGLAKRAL